jgi:hypothetical protein
LWLDRLQRDAVSVVPDTSMFIVRIPEFSDTQSGVFVHVSVGSKAA